MALDLDDAKVLDYSSKIDLFPFNVYGTFVLDILAYEESGPAGSEKNPGDKEYDLATCKVLESSAPELPVGALIGFFFQTGGDGVTIKSRPYKAAALRNFQKAVAGVAATDRVFEANKARKTLLETDLSEGDNKVHLTTERGNPIEGKPGEFYRDDTWRPVA